MTTISAKIIEDSYGNINGDGSRLTTLQLRYPRAIHAEFMTHRQFSRNASSSRAIPVERLIKDVEDDPYIPLHWGKNQKGMQADGECDAPIVFTDIGTNEKWSVDRQQAWLQTMESSVRVARAFAEAGYHKQNVNRLLEPWAHINVVVTATEWENFFALRIHKDAEPHIKMLAENILLAMEKSDPTQLSEGQWHLPYITSEDRKRNSFSDLPMISAARCARVSYLTHDGLPPSRADDLDLAQSLIDNGHWSPLEHQAYLSNKRGYSNFSEEWMQYRKTFPGECKSFIG